MLLASWLLYSTRAAALGVRGSREAFLQRTLDAEDTLPDPAGLLKPCTDCPPAGPLLDTLANGLGGNNNNAWMKIPAVVEVLTTDVGLANRVRTDNVTIAKETAATLGVPVSRIHVLPWSWTPQHPASPFLALLQEHNQTNPTNSTCGCPVTGKLRDGWGNPWQRVMTVPEFYRLREQQIERMPPARVQMLTRDPCLVYRLHKYTEAYRDLIAKMLDVPVRKVQVSLPPVQGLVGAMLVQTGSSSVSLLAVRQASCEPGQEDGQPVDPRHDMSVLQQKRKNVPTERSQLVDYIRQRLGAGGQDPSSSQPYTEGQAPQGWLTHGMPPTDTGAASLSTVTAYTCCCPAAGVTNSPNGTTSTVATASVATNASAPTSASKSNVTAGGCVPALPNGVCSPGYERNTCYRNVTLPALTCAQGNLSNCTNATGENRPWIYVWSVSILQPDPNGEAMKLLLDVDEGCGDLAKLLPLTLARVPGLNYPTFANNTLSDVRLPPPADTAIGIRVPKFLTPKERKEEQLEMQTERQERLGNLKRQAVLRERQLFKDARGAMMEGLRDRHLLKEEMARVQEAARNHATKLSMNAATGPSLQPWEVAAQLYKTQGDSPYDGMVVSR